MSRESLNEAFGPMAEPPDIDPTHVSALAQRIANLAQEDGRLSEKVDALVSMLEKRLPTEEEIKKIREVLSDKAGREWLRTRFNRWGIGGLGVMGTLYLTRTWWSQMFAQLSAWLK